MSESPMIAIGREELLLDLESSRRDNEDDGPAKRSHGFHLVRSKWDPYPWIGLVEKASSAEASGLRSGDCLLEVDGRDVLGLQMSDIGRLIGKNDRVNLSIWRRPASSNEANLARFSEDTDANRQQQQASVLVEGPLPEVAQKLARAVSGIVKALECPVCLEISASAPPVSQCVHGHLLCSGCRLKTNRCPVCRVRLVRGRCLLADKVHRLLSQVLLDETRSLRDCIFRAPAMPATDCPPGNDRRLAKKPRVKRLLEKLLLSSSSARPTQPCDDRDDDVLTGSTESIDASSVDGNLLYGRRWLLRLYDRRKSASTGELDRNGVDAKETARSSKTSFTDLTFKSAAATSLLCVPQMSSWGGSTESMTASRISCPLSLLGRCHRVLDSSSLMEHLEDQHDGPIVHFYKRRVTIPFPFPFQGDAIYALHQKDDILILQTHENKIWISNVQVDRKTRWEWMLHATSTDGNEIHLRKAVADLHEPCQLMSHQIATIPDHFLAISLAVSLIEINFNEGCVKV